MEGGTLQDWKLYRQFQRTLDAINTEIQDEDFRFDSCKVIDRFNDSLEITNVEDEGEQMGGESKNLWKFNETLELKSYFNQWRDLVDLAVKQRRKAEFYHRFISLERGFKGWKRVTRQEKDKRERKKWIKAVAFDEHRLLRSHLRTWVGYTKLMSSKRELRDLEKLKEKSSAKVGQFLLNLQTLKRQIEQDRASMSSRKTTPVHRCRTTPNHRSKSVTHVQKKKKKISPSSNDFFITAPSSVERLSPFAREQGCFGTGNPGLVDEAGHPLVSIKEAATIVADYRGNMTKTVVQRGHLSDQFFKMKDQQREINEMEQIKQQLQLGRAVTNLDLYRSLIFKSNSGARRQNVITNGLSVAPNGRITKNEVIALKFQKEPQAEKTDFSNLRGQAPVATRKKELRNIIVPQEEIRKANREFWRNEENDEYDSDVSEPELKKLFNPQLLEDDQDDSEVQEAAKKKNSTPTFLIQMRKRQQERAEKREEIRKFHELKAEEKRRQAFEAETLRIQKEEEEKIKKRKELRKMIRQEKADKKKRQTELEKFQILNRKAKAFNQDRLLRKFGIEPWKRLIQEKKINEFWAEKHHEMFLKKRCLQDWIHWTKSNQIMRRVKAEEFEKQKLLTNSFGKWVEAQMSSRRKLQAAFDFNEMRLTALIFKNWRAINDHESRLQFKKDLQAIKHHRRNILKRLLNQWIKFVASRDEYETMENLRRHFQAQVALEIPDYSPASSEI